MQGKAADWRRRTAATKTKAARQTLAGQAGGCWTDGDGRTTGIRTTGVRTDNGSHRPMAATYEIKKMRRSRCKDDDWHASF